MNRLAKKYSYAVPLASVTPKVAYVYGKAASKGFTSGNALVKDFINTAVKAGKTASPAFKKTIASLASQKGAASVGALGMGAVLGAGAIGAASIYLAGKKTSKGIKKLGEQMAAQQDSILKGIRARRKK